MKIDCERERSSTCSTGGSGRESEKVARNVAYVGTFPVFIETGDRETKKTHCKHTILALTDSRCFTDLFGEQRASC